MNLEGDSMGANSSSVTSQHSLLVSNSGLSSCRGALVVISNSWLTLVRQLWRNGSLGRFSADYNCIV